MAKFTVKSNQVKPLSSRNKRRMKNDLGKYNTLFFIPFLLMVFFLLLYAVIFI